MRVLVCGDRHWADKEALEAVLNVIGFERWGRDLVIIEGTADGADRMAGRWAERSCGHEEYPAEWNVHGKAAGPIRNQRMLDEGKPDLVLAFHDHLPKSKGTRDMVRRARNAGLPVLVFKHRATK